MYMIIVNPGGYNTMKQKLFSSQVGFDCSIFWRLVNIFSYHDHVEYIVIDLGDNNCRMKI